MMNRKLLSIACGILVWILGVFMYLLSLQAPILENTTLQSNIVLVLGIIPSSYIGTYLFYSKNYLKPSTLALTFVTIATLLDALVTVPMFIISDGGSYSSFFGDPMFYIILVEFYFMVLYFGIHLTKTRKA